MKNLATSRSSAASPASPHSTTSQASIAANYRRKNKDGVWEDDPHFNEVTIFDASTRR